MEAESNVRLGTVYSRDLEENEMSLGQMEQEITELTSTGLISTEMEGEYTVQERLRQLRSMMRSIGPRDNQRRTNFDANSTLGILVGEIATAFFTDIDLVLYNVNLESYANSWFSFLKGETITPARRFPA